MKGRDVVANRQLWKPTGGTTTYFFAEPVTTEGLFARIEATANETRLAIALVAVHAFHAEVLVSMLGPRGVA